MHIVNGAVLLILLLQPHLVSAITIVCTALTAFENTFCITILFVTLIYGPQRTLARERARAPYPPPCYIPTYNKSHI